MSALGWLLSRFPALRSRDFSLFWFGALVSLSGTWIQNTAQSWLVLQLTKSALWLGIMGFVASLPTVIFALLGGALADRLPKRALVTVTQTAFMLVAFALALLVDFERVRVWHIVVASLVTGTGMAVDMPARQAFVPHLAGKDNLSNAIGLVSVAFNTARVAGPALAGYMVARGGMALCFYINAATFVAVIVALMLISDPGLPRPRERHSVITDARVGLYYVWNHRAIRAILLMLMVVTLCGASYGVLMPIVAQRVLGLGAAGFGMLMSSGGVGALVGALAASQTGTYRRKGRMLLAMALLFAIALLLLAGSRLLWLSMVAVGTASFSMLVFMITCNTTIQTLSDPIYRGRVMGVYMLSFVGPAPLGSLLMGALAHWRGAPFAIAVGASVMAAFVLIVGIWVPMVRRIRT
jgi:MFS family permease